MTGALEGKTVIVTGAGRGLGRSYAIEAARQGARVVVNDIDRDCAEAVCDVIRQVGGEAIGSADSVTSVEGARAIVDLCCHTFGGLDVLLNNAGLFFHGSAEEVDLERAAALVSVNLLGVLNCGVMAMRVMTKARPGTIVNVTSGASLGIAGMSVYGASKAGVSALTTHWAMESPNGITAIGLSPIAETRMSAGFRSQSPVLPEQIAPIAAFLMSDKARAFNGLTIRLAAGQLSILRQSHFSAGVAWDPGWDHDRMTIEIERLRVSSTAVDAPDGGQP